MPESVVLPTPARRLRDESAGNQLGAPQRDAPPLAPGPESEPPHPSRSSLRGLDWFIFFVADVQTGFGPFIAVYLTSQKWTQVDIGLVLSMSGVIALIGQMPGGALVDAGGGDGSLGEPSMLPPHAATREASRKRIG